MRIMRITNVNPLTGSYKGTFNNEVTIQTTESFDVMEFLGIKKLEGGRDE